MIIMVDPDQYTAIPVPAKIIKLLIADTTNTLLADQHPVEDAESVGDDDEVRKKQITKKRALILF